MTVTTTTRTPDVTRPRTTVTDDLFERLVVSITADRPGVSPSYASRIVDQTLAFLDACARAPFQTLAPSKAVDLGWHAFILHTVDYAEFCHRAASRFIHHVPTDPRTDRGTQTATATLTTMHALGLPVDHELWTATDNDNLSDDCTQCHAGCVDSP